MSDWTISTPDLNITWDSDGALDGVIALLYFLQHPTVRVDALTVSYGEAHPDIYTRNLPRMFARLGRRTMPIAAGRATPLRGNNTFPLPWRAAVEAFLGIDLPEVNGSVDALPAADLIIKVVNQSPSPVALFVCGPHTNLAEALRLDPSIRDKIAYVQVMGGALYVPHNIEAEWPGLNELQPFENIQIRYPRGHLCHKADGQALPPCTP